MITPMEKNASPECTEEKRSDVEQIDTVPAASPDKPLKERKHRSGRTRAREFALQALYQFYLGGGDVAAIETHTQGLSGFNKADAVFFDTLFHGCVREAESLDAHISSALDRPLKEISPIELGCMWLGVYEFLRCPDVPYRVVINEYVELAKSFGGTDGFR